MAAQSNGTNGVPVVTTSEDAPRKLKILMLHGPSPILLLSRFTLISMSRIHPKRPSLPRQNPRSRKTPHQSISSHHHHQNTQVLLPLNTTLHPLPRRHPPPLPHRPTTSPTRRHPRLRCLRCARLHRLRRLGLVEARDWLRELRRARARAGFHRWRDTGGWWHRWCDWILAGRRGRGNGCLDTRTRS